jgi:molecular chaperone GrpE
VTEPKKKPEKINFDHILKDDGSPVGAEDDDVIEIVDESGSSESQGVPGSEDTDGSGKVVTPAYGEDDPGAEAVEALLNETLQEKEEFRDLYLRARADFENLKKRVSRETEEQRIRAATTVVRELLPALDNLQLAMEQASEQPAILEGLQLIQKQFHDALGKVGVEPVEALGENFDPAVHEAMAAEQREDFAPNTIIEEIRKGYTLGGRVVRPSLVKVVVAVAAAAASESEGSTGESDGTDHRD